MTVDYTGTKMNECPRLIGILGCGLVWLASARAQCVDLVRLVGESPRRAAITTSASVDDDGNLQTAARFYIAFGASDWGDSKANTIAEWDGNRFVSTTPGFVTGSSASSLVAWDPDGSGPKAQSLMVCGKLQPSTEAVARPLVARWTGDRWEEFPLNGITNVVSTNALVVWDSDGAGPLAPRLVLLGQFSVTGGASNAAFWDGAVWKPLITFPAVFAAAPTIGCSFDPDGDGPQRPRLIVASNTSSGVVQFDGITRSSLGSFSGTVSAMASVDLDGNGPGLPALFIGGTAGGPFKWNGNDWEIVGGGVLATSNLVRTVSSLVGFDEDGSGPAPPVLVVGGFFASQSGALDRNIISWNGVNWTGFGNTLDSEITCLAEVDADGAGAARPELFAFSASSARPASRRQQGTWVPAPGYESPGLGSQGQGETDIVTALAQVPSSDGASPDAIVAVGAFDQVGLENASFDLTGRFGAAIRQGGRWAPIGRGFDDIVNAVAVWDSDGSGPAAPQIAIGGNFVRIAGVSNLGVSRWTGAAWVQMGAGLTFSGAPRVSRLATWDFDGEGSQPPMLIACGGFTASGTQRLNGVARWSGTAWQPIGPGLNSGVFAFSHVDPDGDGPAPDQLVAVGRFRGLGGSTSDRSVECVARWDGTTWRPLGDGTPPAFGQPSSGLAAEVYDATNWDPDGDGPLPGRLVIGGWFSSINGDRSMQGLAIWNGTRWETLGLPVSGLIRVVAVIDPDGSGPLSARLVVAGDIDGGLHKIAVCDGRDWTFPSAPVTGTGSGETSPIGCSLVWDRDASGPAPANLLLGGSFDLVGTANHGHITALEFRRPEVRVTPTAATAVAGERVELVASSENVTPPSIFRWFFNDHLIEDGITPFGTTASGATTERLRLENIHVADSGFYVCEVDDGCGVGRGQASALTVTCPADFNGDEFLSFEDFDDFVSAFESGGSSADFNGDEMLSCEDFDAFVVAFEQGC